MIRFAIYSDYVHHSGPLYSALKKAWPGCDVTYMNAVEVVAWLAVNEFDIFFLPGGASRYKSAKLNGAGNSKIRQYVKNGGTFVGICAGAYSACSNTKWAVGTPFEILTDNELDFFSGSAIGPIERFSTAEDRNGSAARLVHLAYGEASTRSLYWGGCQFVPSGNNSIRTIATFNDLTDNNLAVIAGEYGRGRWLLSSIHFEYDNEALDLSNFDVPDNKYRDIAALGDWSDLNLNLFKSSIESVTPKLTRRKND